MRGAIFKAPRLENFDACRRSTASGAAVPHPALRAGLSRQGEAEALRCPAIFSRTPSMFCVTSLFPKRSTW